MYDDLVLLSWFWKVKSTFKCPFSEKHIERSDIDSTLQLQFCYHFKFRNYIFLCNLQDLDLLCVEGSHNEVVIQKASTGYRNGIVRYRNEGQSKLLHATFSVAKYNRM